MKRLAVLILLAAIGSRGTASDLPLPLPTGMAATAPSVPAPVVTGGLPSAEGTPWARTSFRDRLGVGTTYEMTMEEAVAGPRLWSRLTSWRPFGKPCRDCQPVLAKPTWSEPCAPVVKHPLPPLPGNLSTSHHSTSYAPAAKPSGSCFQKLKDWVCFHDSAVRMPHIPTSREPALYTYFSTQERPGISGTGNCATGNCAGGKAKIGRVGTCQTCPTPGEVIAPGYRLANPEGR